jgi:glycosyltransferase involved in cell wall biosynthesis
MQLSFIIPHKGRFEMLIETIESIINQQTSDHSFEVIVVSQTDEIKDCILTTSDKLQLKVFTRPVEDTISSSRNFGVEQAQGDYLAFLDADIYLSSNWVEQMFSELLGTPERIIVSAMQVCNADAPALEQIRTSLSNVEIDQDVAFLPGRNLFMSKASFKKIGGFPEHLVTCEDYYFTDQAAKLGKLYYTSLANYRHIGEDKEFSAMFKKEIWRGQSNIQSLAGRKIPLRELPSFFVPPAILFLLVAAVFCLLSGWPELAMVSLVFAMLPVVVYSSRLFILAQSKVQLIPILWFYMVYFPARAIGTFAGLFKTIKVK